MIFPDNRGQPLVLQETPSLRTGKTRWLRARGPGSLSVIEHLRSTPTKNRCLVEHRHLFSLLNSEERRCPQLGFLGLPQRAAGRKHVREIALLLIQEPSLALESAHASPERSKIKSRFWNFPGELSWRSLSRFGRRDLELMGITAPIMRKGGLIFCPGNLDRQDRSSVFPCEKRVQCL